MRKRCESRILLESLLEPIVPEELGQVAVAAGGLAIQLTDIINENNSKIDEQPVKLATDSDGYLP